METTGLTEVKKHLRPGRVYRRKDLARWSTSVDRHLKTPVDDGDLKRLRYGMYYCPRKRAFGEAPASERELVQAFLKTDHFVVTSPSLYNQLGLGTTQLYDKRVVYNQKRHGTFDLGGRVYQFERRRTSLGSSPKSFCSWISSTRSISLPKIEMPCWPAFARLPLNWIPGCFPARFRSTPTIPASDGGKVWSNSYLHDRNDFREVIDTVGPEQHINDHSSKNKGFVVIDRLRTNGVSSGGGLAVNPQPLDRSVPCFRKRSRTIGDDDGNTVHRQTGAVLVLYLLLHETQRSSPGGGGYRTIFWSDATISAPDGALSGVQGSDRENSGFGAIHEAADRT